MRVKSAVTRLLTSFRIHATLLPRESYDASSWRATFADPVRASGSAAVAAPTHLLFWLLLLSCTAQATLRCTGLRVATRATNRQQERGAQAPRSFCVPHGGEHDHSRYPWGHHRHSQHGGARSCRHAALLREMVAANGMAPEDLAAATFTVTADLDAAFPAQAARELGWEHVPCWTPARSRCRAACRAASASLLLWNTDAPGGHRARLSWATLKRCAPT